MLKKINRISREVEIKEVLKDGRYLHDEFWMRKVLNPSALRAPSLDRAGKNKKFLIIISKKIAKLAVDRNRMKRLAYTVIYKNLEKLPEGIRMVLVVKKPYEKIGDEIVGGL
ncbi:MAG: ribonuclease P protein component [Candidatus Shapirobacteria bacterium]